MKKSLLLILPAALIVAGCSGNLKKGDIFNEKFMKQNYSVNEVTVENEGWHKTLLNLGSDINAVAPVATANVNGILRVEKTDGKVGLYSTYEDRFVLPVDTYDVGSAEAKHYSNGAIQMNFFMGKKTVETVTTIYIYDEYGNLLYSGNSGAVSFNGGVIGREDRKNDEHIAINVRVGGQIKVTATYNIKNELKEVLSFEERAEQYEYTFDGTNLKMYGHEELISTFSQQPGIGIRYQVYNTKKDKFISSFVVPENITPAEPLMVGDHLIYQVIKELHEREKKYDFYDEEQGMKYNFETYRVNYLTGKEEKINTKFVFSLLQPRQTLLDKKGEYKYEYLNGVREIQKDKTLSLQRRAIIVDEKLKEVADVSGINLSTANIKPFGDYYIANDTNTIYDAKLKEVGKLQNAVAPDKHICIRENGYGLVNHVGKFIFSPGARNILPLMKGYYVASFDGNFKVLKMASEDKVEVVREFSETEYPMWYQDSSTQHLYVLDKENVAYVYDIVSNQLTKAETIDPINDHLVGEWDGVQLVNDSIDATISIYKNGDNYYMYRTMSKTIESFPSYK